MLKSGHDPWIASPVLCVICILLRSWFVISAENFREKLKQNLYTQESIYGGNPNKIDKQHESRSQNELVSMACSSQLN